MKIVLKNKYGAFEIGGASHPVCRLQQISGIGLVGKSFETMTFAGGVGAEFKNIYDSTRTITMLIDFYSTPRLIEQLYTILSDKLEIEFYIRDIRRKIDAYVLSGAEVENIIYNKWVKIPIQMHTENPYFTDFVPIKVPVIRAENKFPNAVSDGIYVISLPAVATQSKHSAIVKNSGGVDIYPVIRIQNTGKSLSAQTGIKITNITTGTVIRINHQMSAGEVIEADFESRRITSDGIDITGSISNDTVLSDFFLPVGESEIKIETVGAELLIYAECEYINKYRTVII